MVLLIWLTAAAALSASGASAAGACPNEQARQESNLNSEGQPYSALLPDCRAYEMVSPLEKQGRDAGAGEVGTAILPIAASPGGGAAGWSSEGSFSGPENYGITSSPENFYRSLRGSSGWTTSSAFGPRKLVNEPFQGPFDGDFSPDLTSHHATCGTNTSGPGRGEIGRASLACATRAGTGEWKVSPSYEAITGQEIEGSADYLGGSSDLSRLFVQPQRTGALQGELGEAQALTIETQASQGIYELAGIGSTSPTLRLVNVGNPSEGKPFGEEMSIAEGSSHSGPLLGDQRANTIEWGGARHAISEDGRTVFFTATPPPPAEPPESEVLTIYARRQCVPEPAAPNCAEDGNGEYFETIAVSDGSECSACAASERKPAYFLGASADGSKVFFMTEQKLLSEEAVPTRNLYEYDFGRPAGKKLVLLSQVEAKGAASVQGVLAVSADGSHVYFLAQGVLTKNTYTYERGEAKSSNLNLYGYDTVTGKGKFIASASGAPNVWGLEETEPTSGNKLIVGPFQNEGGARPAQVTPDGRDVVFSSSATLTEHKLEHGATAVYRYDFPTGELAWVSHPAPGFTPAGGEQSASIASQPGRRFNQVGPNADLEDWGRAISGLKVGEAEREYADEYDGEYIIFTTATQLQENAANGARNLYEWHCPGNVECAKNATVSLISDGVDRNGVQLADNATATAMSATGSDIFFSTTTRLVGQDTDSLRDVYDARVGGGFPAPSEPGCSGEACQGPAKKPEAFEPPASTSFVPGGNLPPPSIVVTPPSNAKPPPVSPARQLAAALKACKKATTHRTRVSCETRARKRYRAQLLATTLKACKKKSRSKRAACEANARKRHRR